MKHITHEIKPQPKVITVNIGGLIVKGTNTMLLRKTPQEKSLLKQMKNEVNSELRDKFGTKRVGNVKFTRHAKLSII